MYPQALGKGIYGKVLKGNYRESPVAVKRLMPCSLAGPRFLPFDTSLQPSEPLDPSAVNEAIKEVLSTSNSEVSLSRYNRGMGTPFGSLLWCTEDDIMSTPYKVIQVINPHTFAEVCTIDAILGPAGGAVKFI